MTEDDKDKPTVEVVMNTNASSARLLAAMHGEVAGDAEVKDPVDIKPEIVGPHGRAWTMDSDALRRRLACKPENDGHLVTWIVEAPWAHPAWHSYAISCVHLRPLSDNRRTLIWLPSATHEMSVYALDPDKPRQPVIKGDGVPSFLTPGNFAAQFIEIDDKLATARIEDSVRLICEGALSPDTDFTSQWIERFNDSMMLDRKSRREPEVRGG